MLTKFISPTSLGAEMGIYEFTKEIELERGGCGNIKIFASTRYILYINGKYVCEGPCRSSSDIRYFDEIESDLFVPGKNTVCVRVMHVSDNNLFTSAMKSNYPMLIFKANIGGQVVETDATWCCEYISSIKLTDPNKMVGSIAPFIPPFEEITYPAQKQALEVAECGIFDFEMKEYNVHGIGKPYYLFPRPIPMIYPRQPVVLKVVKSGDGFIELDAGEYTTAKVEVDIAGETHAKIIYSECYQFGGEKGLRDDTAGELVGAWDSVNTDGDVTYSPYWFRAFRFIRIETADPASAIRQVRAYRVNYPFDITGSFECSDDNYNKMWDVSTNTLKCCTHEIFVDCPHYEQQQYVMDSAIESAVAMRLTHDTRMVRKCISEFAASQQPSGLLCANYPCSYTQIIPGFSFFFVFLLKDYLEYSADVAFAAKYTGVIDKIFAYFDTQVREKGYITTSMYWDYQDWVDGWPHGKSPVPEGEAIAIYNLYYACALKEAAYIFRKAGRELVADEYMQRYEKIKDTINSLCYNRDKGMYRDGSGCDTYCVHTAVWAILADVVPEGELPRVAACISDMSISRASFSMNYYLFRAMEKCGRYDYAKELLGGWQTMLDNHCTTWCENPGNPRSECHAWSCAPVHEFSSHILGVKYSFEDVINIQPETLGLSFAKGSVPTRHGMVDISWKVSDGRFAVEIAAPDGVAKNVTLPDGTTHSFEGASAKLECDI
ncbi:MAG: hypothetical protein IJ365_03610 [Clostridia bacterium]|nr:hypothetical protein [Clostridia bacterium]